ncbi:hypothetical protein T4D_14096, partial [Trichinella pseudospiralis]
MNVFTKRLSATGIFHENHEHHGNYRVSIKLQEEVHTWRLLIKLYEHHNDWIQIVVWQNVYRFIAMPLGGTPFAISE